MELNSSFIRACLFYLIFCFSVTSVVAAKRDAAVPTRGGRRSRHASWCPKGFTPYRNMCLKTSPVRASWAEAQTYCKSMHRHAQLLSLTTLKEITCIKNFVRVDPNTASLNYWIGGNNLRDEKCWEWVNLRRPVNFATDWQPFQPDNKLGGENCMLMDRQFNHRWNDKPCHMPYHFICEIRRQGRKRFDRRHRKLRTDL